MGIDGEQLRNNTPNSRLPAAGLPDASSIPEVKVADADNVSEQPAAAPASTEVPNRQPHLDAVVENDLPEEAATYRPNASTAESTATVPSHPTERAEPVTLDMMRQWLSELQAGTAAILQAHNAQPPAMLSPEMALMEDDMLQVAQQDDLLLEVPDGDDEPTKESATTTVDALDSRQAVASAKSNAAKELDESERMVDAALRGKPTEAPDSSEPLPPDEATPVESAMSDSSVHIEFKIENSLPLTAQGEELSGASGDSLTTEVQGAVTKTAAVPADENPKRLKSQDATPASAEPVALHAEATSAPSATRPPQSLPENPTSAQSSNACCRE